MKTFKKIGLGLCLVSLLFSIAASLASPKVTAATPPNFNLQFSDSKGSSIKGTLYNNPFTLTLSQSSGPNWVYVMKSNNEPICVDSFITVNGSKASTGSATSATASASTFSYQPSATSKCGVTYGGTLSIKAYSGGPAPKSTIPWDTASGKVSADGKTLTVSFSNNSYTFTDNDTTDNIFNWKPASQTGGNLGGAIVAGWCPNSVSGTGDNQHGISITNLSDTTATVKLCYNNGGTNPVNDDTTMTIDASAFAATRGDSSGSTAPSACEANSGGWSFTWAVCPVLDAANGLTTLLIGIFEDQLSFSVNQLGSGTDPNSGNYKVHQSWSAVKDVASALVVLIMLVMVFSQAVSFGPFDAYTIRKLLPRLVAAVILMQISWPLFSYALDLVNDLARGIADIMYFPFNGAGNMDLWHLLANAKLSNGLLAAMDWGALLVFVVLGVAFLFTMLGMALTAIIALCFAVITLVFRKILIITLLIFAPIALLAWILPGTKKYWDMWWSNFIKALMMFPLIVAIIAAGRIFAYIVGTQDNSQFLNLIFIMIGFFGPLFLLPKTFRWGGQAMQMAGNGIMKASSKVSERPKKYFDKRQEEYNAQKRISAADRLRKWDQGQLSRGGKLMSALRGDKFKAGDWDPVYLAAKAKVPLPGGKKIGIMPGGREMARQQEENKLKFRAAAIRAENEEREFAAQRLEEEASHSHPGNEDAFYKAVFLNADGKYSQAERYAALDKIADIGGEGNLKFIEQQSAWSRSQSTEEQAAFAKFTSRKAGSLFAKLPHLDYYKGIERAASGLKPEDITNLSSTATQTMIDELQPRAAAGDARAQQALDHLYSAYQLAASSEATNRRISFEVRDTIENSLGHASVPPGVAATVRSASARIQTGAAAPSPADIRTQHAETWQASLPGLTALTDPAQRQAYKVRLTTDPGAREVLAHGLAYDASPPAERAEHEAVLAEMQATARTGTPEQKAAFNSIIDQIQQALNKRADDAAQHVGATGGDAAAQGAARQAEFAAIAPLIARYDGMRLL